MEGRGTAATRVRRKRDLDIVMELLGAGIGTERCLEMGKV
jgi:hypothetical protein